MNNIIVSMSIFLAVLVFTRGQQQERECIDEKPEQALFGCYRYAKLGLCKELEEKFCRKSCERCDCNEVQAIFCDVQGLIAFKNSFVKGQEYLKSWRGDNPCNEWEFIYCNPLINRVVHMEMRLIYTIIQHTMQGSLVPDISKLRHLQHISVWSVYLNGELPLEYSVLKKLQYFGLQDTHGVNGTLPAQYTMWTQITHLDITNSHVTGTIPVEFSSWTSIELLTLDSNSLYGKIPPNFSTWKYLEIITLVFNKFSRTLAPEFSEWDQVYLFSVLSNQFSETLPKEYSSLSRMRIFSVGDNKLRGRIPAEFSEWAVCEIFDVSLNFLSGTLPVEYSRMKRTKAFFVYGNYFRGWLPKEYSTMIRLENFRVYNAKINNHIPQEWSKLQEQAKIELTETEFQYIVHGIQQRYLSP